MNFKRKGTHLFLQTSRKMKRYINMKRNFLRKLMLTALSVTVLASAVGCGASSDDKSSSGDGSAEGSSGGKLQEIIDNGDRVFRVVQI